MFFHIDPSNGLAIYSQIVRQIKFAVAGEALRPGEMVPSVRELARELAVNPNTVSRAYRDGRLGSIGGGSDETMLGIICKYMHILPKK